MAGLFKGSVRDDTIAKRSGICQVLPCGETLLGDGIYRSVDPFQVPVGGKRFELCDEERAYNYIIYAIRQSVERLIHRIRIWGVLNGVWRLSFALLGLCVRVCMKLTNFFLIFNPLG